MIPRRRNVALVACAGSDSVGDADPAPMTDQCCELCADGDLAKWFRVMQSVVDDGWYPLQLDQGVSTSDTFSRTERVTLRLWGLRDIHASFFVPGVVMKRRELLALEDRRVELWQTLGVELGKALGAL